VTSIVISVDDATVTVGRADGTAAGSGRRAAGRAWAGRAAAYAGPRAATLATTMRGGCRGVATEEAEFTATGGIAACPARRAGAKTGGNDKKSAISD
jgi:hypothetical protein